MKLGKHCRATLGPLLSKRTQDKDSYTIELFMIMS